MDTNSVDQLNAPNDSNKKDLTDVKYGALPTELLWKIFSKLTFLECVRCSFVSKRWRSAVQSWPYIGNTLSNEGHAYKLSRILPIYKYFISRSSVRVLHLTADRITRTSHSSATEELTQLIHLLELFECDSIQKATIKMYCFSEEKWFQTFLRITSTTLTHLSLSTVTIPSKMQYVFKLILTHSRNLKHLSYRSKILLAYKSIYESDPINQMPTRPLEEIAKWDTTQQLYSVQHLPHQALPLTALNLEADTMNLSGIHPLIFSRLPHLQCLRAIGDIFSGTPRDFYRTLFEHCPKISYFHYVDCCTENISCHWLTLLSHQRRGYYEQNNGAVVNNYFKLDNTSTGGVRRLCIGSNCSGTGAKNHSRAVLQLYHETMIAMHLNSPDGMIHCTISSLSFPRLQRLTGKDNTLMIHSMTVFPWGSWLRALRHMREVQLFEALVTRETFMALRLLGQLEILVVKDCHLISIRKRNIYRIFEESIQCTAKIVIIRCYEY